MGAPTVRASQADLEQRYRDAVAAVRQGSYDKALASFSEIRAADAADDDRFVRSPLGRKAALNVAILTLSQSSTVAPKLATSQPPQKRATAAQEARQQLDQAEAALRAATSTPTGEQLAAVPNAYLTGANLALQRAALDTLAPFDVERIGKMTLGMDATNLRVTAPTLGEIAKARGQLDLATQAQKTAAADDKIDGLDQQVATFRRKADEQQIASVTAFAIGAMTAVLPAPTPVMNVTVANTMGDTTQLARGIIRAAMRAPGDVRGKLSTPPAWADMWVNWARAEIAAVGPNDASLQDARKAANAELALKRQTVR